MIAFLRRKIRRFFLKEERFAFLWDEPPSDEYVVFDCETTGLNTKTDELLALCAIRIDGKTLKTSEKLSLIIKPTGSITESSIKIHHIRNCDVRDGICVDDAIEMFVRFIGARPLVGYYIQFDAAIVNRYFKRLSGTYMPNKTIEVSELYFDAFNDIFGSKNVDLRFDSMAKKLNIPLFQKHSAYYDALSTGLMFLKLTSHG